ncbi:MAG: 2-polyprenylphenol 6-hydroxylase, partial [Pseudomonadota bacterium]
LQRTMVVVEGVSRSLDPELNIWETSKPVVEAYIRDNLGPTAVVRDLRKTAEILSRYGPLLPVMAERALIAADKPSSRRRVEDRPWPNWLWMLTGAVIGATLFWVFG